MVLENFDKQCLRLLHYISAQLGTEPSSMICLGPVPCPFMTACPTYIMAIPVLSFHLGSTVNFNETKSFVCVCVRTCFLFLVGFKDLQICITVSLILLVAEYEQDGAQQKKILQKKPSSCYSAGQLHHLYQHELCDCIQSQKTFVFWAEYLGSSLSM